MPRRESPSHGHEAWIARARGHLALARQPKPPDGFWEGLADHAQQVAELAMKGIYVRRGLAFRFTHALGELRNGLARAGVVIPSQIHAAVTLTRSAVHARYPGVGLSATREEHERAVRVAEDVLRWAEEVVGAP